MHKVTGFWGFFWQGQRLHPLKGFTSLSLLCTCPTKLIPLMGEAVCSFSWCNKACWKANTRSVSFPTGTRTKREVLLAQLSWGGIPPLLKQVHLNKPSAKASARSELSKLLKLHSTGNIGRSASHEGEKEELHTYLTSTTINKWHNYIFPFQK